MSRLLVVTGQSGAGKSTCLAALADSGFHCVDNLPLPFLPELAAYFSTRGQPLAVGVDARDPEGLAGLADVLSEMSDRHEGTEVIFLAADDETLLRRFSQTRRRHPLGDLPEALTEEKRRLEPLRAIADTVLDTTGLSGRELRQVVRDRYAGGGRLRIALWSFGFARGIPPHADLVFDARCLANPHADPALRPLTGLHTKVAQYVLDQPDAGGVLDMALQALAFWTPRVRREGRAYLTVAIGCTGGRHRSVALVEALARRVRTARPPIVAGAELVVRHRDLGEGT